MPPYYDNHQAARKDIWEIEKMEKINRANVYVEISMTFSVSGYVYRGLLVCVCVCVMIHASCRTIAVVSRVLLTQGVAKVLSRQDMTK